MTRKRIARKAETVDKLQKLKSICDCNRIELDYNPQQIKAMKSWAGSLIKQAI